MDKVNFAHQRWKANPFFEVLIIQVIFKFKKEFPIAFELIVMRLTLIHEIDAGLIESAAEQLNDVEAVKNDLGVRETVVNDREVRGIHIHTHGFNGFAGFPGVAHEIADESGHSAIRKDIENLTGFRVKKEKRH